MSEDSASIDHIILLVPNSWHTKPPAALTENFTLYPGGSHGDGKTQNTLIIFPDGVYLELISFLPPEDVNRQGHWWGSKPLGFIDWAITSFSASEVQRARENLRKEGSKWNYEASRKGGRKRPDGVELKWEVTFPSSSIPRGVVPFWCHDITPRVLRVPNDEAATTHPCGAVGVALHLIAKESEVEKWVDTIQSITMTPDEAVLKMEGGWVMYLLQNHNRGSSIGSYSGSEIFLRPPRDEWEQRLLERSEQEVVIAEVVVDCDKAGVLGWIDENVVKDCGFRIGFSHGESEVEPEAEQGV